MVTCRNPYLEQRLSNLGIPGWIWGREHKHPLLVCKVCICMPVYISPERVSVAFVRSKVLCDPGFTIYYSRNTDPIRAELGGFHGIGKYRTWKNQGAWELRGHLCRPVIRTCWEGSLSLGHSRHTHSAPCLFPVPPLGLI